MNSNIRWRVMLLQGVMILGACVAKAPAGSCSQAD